MALDMILCPTNRGPFLYREQRISRGKLFNLLKFRVLKMDVLLQMQTEDEQHARLYEADLNNLTWAGRYIIKKWYFDEAPQFINILRGDMSLVGPRPWTPSLVKEQEERGVVYRKYIIAGLTGPCQVEKGKPSPKNSEILDLAYFETCKNLPAWKLWLHDWNILFKTLMVMVQGKGLQY